MPCCHFCRKFLEIPCEDIEGEIVKVNGVSGLIRSINVDEEVLDSRVETRPHLAWSPSLSPTLAVFFMGNCKISYEGSVDDVTENLAGVKKVADEADDGINIVPPHALSNV